MDIEKKFKILGRQAKFDSCGCPAGLDWKWNSPFIYNAVGEGGRFVRLFKTLQTNACSGNCFYCANRRYREFERMSFTPKELAGTFMEYFRRRAVSGLFLSSAIAGSRERSQEEILETIRLVRGFGFSGYIHAKILPGTETGLIGEVARYADRLSINLEAINQKYLDRLSPNKNFSLLMKGVEDIAGLNRKKPFKAGISTQIIVGASGEKDSEIVGLTGRLYKELRLWRVYYSRFEPVPGTPLENKPACSNRREARLYQADFLLRKYGFQPHEFVFDENGNLPEDIDPKLAWAKAHPELFPFEINTAPFEKILRIPGIGRISARRIVEERRRTKLTDPEQLKKMGVRTGKARDYITLNGKFYGVQTFRSAVLSEEKISYQPFLWEEL